MATATKTKKVSSTKSKTSAAEAAPKKGPFGRPVAAGAKGKKPVARKSKRKALPAYAAPADFRPHFVLASFQTDKDGLLGQSLKAVRYNGRFDRDAEASKKFDMIEYDPRTVVGIAARLAAVTFKTSFERLMPQAPKERIGQPLGSFRLPPSTIFEVLVRVAKKSADGSISAGARQVFQVVKSPKTGKPMTKELEKTDPAYRLIRRVNRILPAAFKNVLMPPKRTRGRRDAADEE